jgi:hypothetical protein
MCNIPTMRKLLIILPIAVITVACSMPFTSKKAPDVSQNTTNKERVDVGSEPKPGDIKIIEGTEYIYAKNRRYLTTSYEPEYIWYRKDQYSPSLFDSIREGFSGDSKKEKEKLEQRLAKLEDDLRKKNSGITQGGTTYVLQSGPLPGVPYAGSTLTPAFTYPSQKMKRKILVLPLSDQTNYKEEHLEELTTKRLIARLENTQTIICIDPSSTNMKSDFVSPIALKELNEFYGVQAVIKGNLSDVFTSTSHTDGRDDKDVSMALAKVSVDVYSTETGKIIRQLSARNPFSLTRERGDIAPERAKVRAIDLAIELLTDDLLKVVLNLDWHARIANIDSGKVFINAGRSSGLEKGDVLEVYTPGEQIIDKTTGLSIGRLRGNYKGELEIQEVFSVDASWGKAKNNTIFSSTDLVYLKKK